MSDNTLPQAVKEYESVLDLAADVNEADQYNEPRCKLCNSEFRQEAEAYWESSCRQHSTVVRFFADKGVKIDDKSVAKHMIKHYLAHQKAVLRKDYADALRPYANIKGDRLSDIELCRAAIRKELMDIGSLGDSLSQYDRNKNSELVMKLTAQLMALNDAEKRFHDDWKPAQIIIEKLTQIVQVEAENAPLETKMLMAKVVDTLYSSCEGVKFDK